MTTPLLRIDRIRVVFDRFVAIEDLSLVLPARELRFLIGPNGAGKTTLLDVICGKVRPNSGRIWLGEGRDLTRMSEHQIVRFGVGRKFQAPTVFDELTVLENLEISSNRERGILSLVRSTNAVNGRERIEQRLMQMRLKDRRHVRAGTLAHGEKQWLEIAMVLLQEPSLLLLDEPVAGMSRMEIERTGELLQEIAREKTVVVVEHDMHFVRQYAQRITVMHEGRILREGSVEEVQSDEMVQEVYVGRRIRHVVG